MIMKCEKQFKGAKDWTKKDETMASVELQVKLIEKKTNKKAHKQTRQPSANQKLKE